jgi:hypothetical protein
LRPGATQPTPHFAITSDKKQADFEALFTTAVHYAKALLGMPLFAGIPDEAGFPREQWADGAAVWKAGNSRLLIRQKHNDRELPLDLCLVFAPPA